MGRSRLHLIFIPVFLLSAFPAWALTLSEALSIAASHPALLESRLNIDQTGASATDAGKRGPDAISFEAENVSGNLPGFSNADLTVSFKRPLLTGGKATAQKRLAAMSIDEAKIELSALKREILLRVQAAFHKVIGLQNLCRNAQEITQLNVSMHETTKIRVEAGAGPEQELLKAQLDIDRVEADRKNLEGQLTEAVLALCREMGLKEDSRIEVVGTLTSDITLPPLAQLQQKILETHPVFLTVAQNVKVNQAQAEFLKAENRTSYNWVAGVRNFRESANNAFVFAIEADLPNKESNQGARNAAVIERTKLEATREKARRELFTALQEQVKRFERSQSTVSTLRQAILPKAQKNLEMAIDGYRLGKTDQIVVLEARKSYAEVTRQSLAALSELYEAIDAIEQLSGVCLVGEHH
ncbi:MAG TPA: TolC family protein [Candidatus Ozemobacteraceae bacterium]|nr:TolC family protein [Candidatus Ozemobacteraceae bacterium]